MKVVFESVVHLKLVVPFQVLQVPVLFPLSPNEVASVVDLIVGTLWQSRSEILLQSPSPPDSSLDYWPDKVEIVPLADIIVEVVFSYEGFYIPVFFVENWIEFLQEFFVGLLHEFFVLEARMIKHAIHPWRIYIEKFE